MSRFASIQSLLAQGMDLTPCLPRAKAFSTNDPFSHAPMTANDWQNYLESNPHSNMAVRLNRSNPGPSHGLAVLDVDADKNITPDWTPQVDAALDKLFPSWRLAPQATSGKNAFSLHIYVACKDILHDRVLWKPREAPGKLLIELKTKAVLIPPSAHPGGSIYGWLRPYTRHAVLQRPFIPPIHAAENILQKNELSKSEYVNIVLRLPVEYIDDYSAWTRLGFALYNSSDAADWALELWDKASALSPSYKPHETTKKWKTFADYTGRRITVGSLLRAISQVERGEETILERKIGNGKR